MLSTRLRLRGAAAAAAVAAACLLTAAAGAAEPAPAARPEAFAAARSVLDARYQTELPTLEFVAQPAEPAAIVLPDYVVKILLVLGAVLVAVLILNAYYGSGRFDAGGDGQGDGAGGLPDFDALRLPDPEALAAAGRHAEAIHALLLRALVMTAGRLQAAWPRSLTSREILRHHALPAAARSHLGQLIERVEVHHFGGLEPAAADFRRCREVYDRLSASLEGRTP